MKYLFFLLSFSLFAQQPAEVFAVYGKPNSKRISIEKVILHIRELKSQSSGKYGEAVDFYYFKIAATGKNKWLEKLEEFSLDPYCPAKNRIKINETIQRIRTLQIGEKAPNIITENFNLHHYKSNSNSLILLFYSPTCFHCTELLVDLIPYSEKKQLTIIALQIDEEMNPFVFPKNWKSMKANADIRRIYGVISTPSLFLLNSKSLQIIALPENLSEIKKSEYLF